MFLENAGQAPFKPDIPQYRMPGRGPDYHGSDVLFKNKTRLVGAVKNEDPLHLRVALGQPLENLVGKPADTFQLIGKQKARIYSYFHGFKYSVINIYFSRF